MGNTKGLWGRIAAFFTGKSTAGKVSDNQPPKDAMGDTLATVKQAKPGLPPSIEELLKQAQTGDTMAQTRLGYCYAEGVGGVPRDEALACMWYEKAAMQGDANAQSNLALMYELGRGVKQDYAKAREWLEKAAEQGNAMAQNNLGFFYTQENTGMQDYALAHKWLEKAVANKWSPAITTLAFLYNNGLGVKKDRERALDLYRQAAEEFNDPNAQNYLAKVHYAAGEYAQAISWWETLAEEWNDPEAQYNLGWIYLKGEGVEPNYAAAIDWLYPSAEQGWPAAQYLLGCMYADGTAGVRDVATARHMLQAALDQGYEAAAEILQQLE